MGKQYSKEEMEQIRTLANEGVTNREIASTLQRPEAGIRNIRYRQKLKAETPEKLQSLLKQKVERRREIGELKWTQHIKHL